MRRFIVLVVLLALAGSGVAQTQRGVPRAIRGVLVGCWSPWPGERWQIRRHGPTGLRVGLSFDREALQGRFRVRRARGYETSISYRPDRQLLEMDCGPTTQHGQFCLLEVDGTELRVARYGRGHGRGHRHGRLVETVTATRCESR